MAVQYHKVITNPLKFCTAYGDKNENSVLRVKAAAIHMKEDLPSA